MQNICPFVWVDLVGPCLCSGEMWSGLWPLSLPSRAALGLLTPSQDPQCLESPAPGLW